MRENFVCQPGRRLYYAHTILNQFPKWRAAWRVELWREIEPFLSGSVRGYLGAAILDGRLWKR